VIGFLRGRLAAKHPPQLVLDVGGVGYEVEAPMSTFYGLPGIGADVSLHTHLVVREDAHTLFGFGTERERAWVVAQAEIPDCCPRRVLLGIDLRRDRSRTNPRNELLAIIETQIS
jgi:Holliday junction DNA helicase RuvA